VCEQPARVETCVHTASKHHISLPIYSPCRFKKAVEKGEIDEQEQKRQHARQSLERYMHYWQRWAENDSSRKKVGWAGGRAGRCPVSGAGSFGPHPPTSLMQWLLSCRQVGQQNNGDGCPKPCTA